MYATYGALALAEATANAFIIINARKIVLDLNGICGTYLFALFTTDTRVFARLARIRALVLVIAHNNDRFIFLNETYHALRAGIGTKTATDAKICINVCNAVLDAYRANGTNRCAIAISKTAKPTGIRTAIHHRSRAAGRISLIFSLFFRRLAISVTVNESNARILRLHLYTEKLSQRVCGILTAGNAKIGLGFSASQSRRIIVTALKSASTAIYTGQASADIFNSFVLFYAEKF